MTCAVHLGIHAVHHLGASRSHIWYGEDDGMFHHVKDDTYDMLPWMLPLPLVLAHDGLGLCSSSPPSVDGCFCPAILMQ